MEEIIKLQPLTLNRSKEKAWEFECNQYKSLQTIYVSHSSNSIDFLQFVRFHCQTETRYPSAGFGTVSGIKFNVVELGPDEELTSVSGYHHYKGRDGYSLKSITFGTNRSTYGPFGADTADMTSGEFKFEMGRRFGGFHGTIADDGELESIGVFIRVM